MELPSTWPLQQQCGVILLLSFASIANSWRYTLSFSWICNLSIPLIGICVCAHVCVCVWMGIICSSIVLLSSHLSFYCWPKHCNVTLGKIGVYSKHGQEEYHWSSLHGKWSRSFNSSRLPITSTLVTCTTVGRGNLTWSFSRGWPGEWHPRIVSTSHCFLRICSLCKGTETLGKASEMHREGAEGNRNEWIVKCTTYRRPVILMSTFWFCVHGLESLGSLWSMALTVWVVKTSKEIYLCNGEMELQNNFDCGSYRSDGGNLSTPWETECQNGRILCMQDGLVTSPSEVLRSYLTLPRERDQVSEEGRCGKGPCAHWCLTWNDSSCLWSRFISRGRFLYHGADMDLFFLSKNILWLLKHAS